LGDLVQKIMRMQMRQESTSSVWKVQLPTDLTPPFNVYLNGVRQRENVDFTHCEQTLEFSRPLHQEGRLGFWRWFIGVWGIGTYKRNDQIDVSWEQDGEPRLAHSLPILPPE
jgi:hypothetical protein